VNTDTQFSKERIEMLCDGVFAIAMTLLVLDLKVPALPKGAPSAEIWRAVGEHGVAFFGFVLTFILAGQFWILHHVLFHYLRHATRALAMLNLLFLMFVSLLPFSTSMFTAFGPRQPVALTFYFGNQLMLSLLLLAQWLIGRRAGLNGADDDVRRRQFGRLMCVQPVGFVLPFAVLFFDSSQAINSLWLGQVFIALIIRRLAKRENAARAAA
jgi:uncharacterized membrane protein